MVRMSGEAGLTELVDRIVAGEPAAEEELVRLYKRGVAIVIDQIVRSQSITSDISQDTFEIVFRKIKRGEVRDPERLSGFVCGVARNTAIAYVRKYRHRTEEVGNAEQIPDPAPNPLEEMLKKEKALVVRAVIDELKSKRDRDLLMRYYIGEEDKDKICADMGLTRLQFNTVNSRASARFKELYLRHMSKS